MVQLGSSLQEDTLLQTISPNSIVVIATGYNLKLVAWRGVNVRMGKAWFGSPTLLLIQTATAPTTIIKATRPPFVTRAGTSTATSNFNYGTRSSKLSPSVGSWSAHQCCHRPYHCKSPTYYTALALPQLSSHSHKMPQDFRRVTIHQRDQLLSHVLYIQHKQNNLTF